MKLFAELTGKEKGIEVLRWLCVVPAVVLAGMAPRVIARLLMPPALAQPPGTPPVPVSDFQRYYLPTIIGIVMAAGFVIVGAKVAPRWRLRVAVVLALLWMLYSFAVHVLPHPVRDLRHYQHFIVASIAAAGSAAYVWHSEKSKRARTHRPLIE
jgi:hypothetical protein